MTPLPLAKKARTMRSFQRPSFNPKTIMVDLANYLKSESKRAGRQIKILSRSPRQIVFFSEQTGYDIDIRRQNWRQYLLYKMRVLKIDYLIMSTRYDFYEHDGVSPHYLALKQGNDPDFELVKQFGYNVDDVQWFGVYRLKR